MCVNIFVFVLCLLLFLFCKYLSKKKKSFVVCTVRSNVSCTFERVHRAAYELTFVCSTVAPHHTHTLLHVCVRTPTFTFERRAHLTHMHSAQVRSNALGFRTHVTYF
jgi:hypothetical protein